MVSSIVYKFSKKTFLVFIIAEIIGFGLLILTLTPNYGGYYTLYFPGTLLIPFSIVVGFYALHRSLRTPYCSQCHFELVTKFKTFSYEKYMDIMNSLRNRDKTVLTTISSISASTKPRTEVTFVYCPGCVSIAKIVISTVGGNQEKKQELSIEGDFVRELKEGLRFN